MFYFFFFPSIFFSSLANLRSTFLTSSAAGRSSGIMPRSVSILRTAALLPTCSLVIELSSWRQENDRKHLAPHSYRLLLPYQLHSRNFPICCSQATSGALLHSSILLGLLRRLPIQIVQTKQVSLLSSYTMIVSFRFYIFMYHSWSLLSSSSHLRRYKLGLCYVYATPLLASSISLATPFATIYLGYSYDIATLSAR